MHNTKRGCLYNIILLDIMKRRASNAYCILIFSSPQATSGNLHKLWFLTGFLEEKWKVDSVECWILKTEVATKGVFSLNYSYSGL
jgi:hypothetical protein